MFVDSLVELSSKVVAKCLVEDRYKHLDLSLEASLNDQIVRQVTRGRREFPASLIAKESGLKLNVTHFYSFPNSRKGLMDFQLHDIQSVYLTLYNFLEVKEFRTGNGGYLDIVDYLRTILNEKSRQNLRELTIEGYGNFEGNWVEKMAELLPNLQSLDSEFSTSIYVKKVCKSFHNLIHLNIRSKPNLKYNSIA
uniref:FBD domain-containing protein n=1 Tax=Caenorhabditis tropicalis TaxID=1561998 RepID=A0A1I7TUG3_9PELO